MLDPCPSQLVDTVDELYQALGETEKEPPCQRGMVFEECVEILAGNAGCTPFASEA